MFGDLDRAWDYLEGTAFKDLFTYKTGPSALAEDVNQVANCVPSYPTVPTIITSTTEDYSWIYKTQNELVKRFDEIGLRLMDMVKAELDRKNPDLDRVSKLLEVAKLTKL